MPCIAASSYRPPRWLPGAHAQTIFPVLFRAMDDLPFERKRIPTPDNDFVDLDILTCGLRPPKGVVILSHGLEGNSRRKYIRGMCLAFAEQGWDCVARNFRACGGDMNVLPGMYHSGQTDDLHTAIEYCIEAGYTRIILTGFSMGGNQVLKYLGEEPDRVPSEVKGAAAFSVPCDLTGCARELDRPQNSVYMRYFMKTLRQKVVLKHKKFPDLYPLEGLESMRTFKEFDGRYTAPVHGFASAYDYWAKSSCLPHLPKIRVKTLLVNAKNDPFLSPSCFPVGSAKNNPALALEMPRHGGHVGFVSPLGKNAYWSEMRAVQFFADELQ